MSMLQERSGSIERLTGRLALLKWRELLVVDGRHLVKKKKKSLLKSPQLKRNVTQKNLLRGERSKRKRLSSVPWDQVDARARLVKVSVQAKHQMTAMMI